MADETPLPAGLVLVRDVTRDEQGNPIPALPAGWTGYHDGECFAVLRRESDGAYLFCAVLADGAELDPPDPDRAVFMAVDPSGSLRAPLRNLVTSSALAWTPAGLRADSGTAATRVKAAIRDMRPLDENGDPVGLRTALHVTIAGYDLRGASEAVTDLGEI
jgi:hypothetical protein